MKLKRCMIMGITACLIIGSMSGCSSKENGNSQLNQKEQTIQTNQTEEEISENEDVKNEEELQPTNHLCIDESRKVEFYPLEDEKNIVHEYNDIVRLEDRAEISYFLNFLSSEQREAVILRFGEQLSFGEIAKVMGCNMRTAQSRVRNALKIMRKEQENER